MSRMASCFLPHVKLVMTCFALHVMSGISSRLLTAGNFIQEMSPLEKTSLSFNDVNSFNSFLDPCGDVWTKFKEYCYHVGAKKMTEEQAQQYCDQEMDANLAKINSKEENDFVLDVAKRHAPSTKGVWIGLKWQSSVKNFCWYDNSFPTFANWPLREPPGIKAKEPCVVMFTGQFESLPIGEAGYWHHVSCDAPHFPAMCKKLY